MANIHTTLANPNAFKVVHNDENANFKLPEWLLEVGLTDRGKIENYLHTLDDDQFLGIWHNNIAQTYIDLRATARPKVRVFPSNEKRQIEFDKIENKNDFVTFETKGKNGKIKYHLTQKLSTDLVGAQKRIDKYKWSATPEPGEGSKKVQEQLVKKELETMKTNIESMLEMGLTLDVIKPNLCKKHNPELVKLAIELLEN